MTYTFREYIWDSADEAGKVEYGHAQRQAERHDALAAFEQTFPANQPVDADTYLDFLGY